MTAQASQHQGMGPQTKARSATTPRNHPWISLYVYIYVLTPSCELKLPVCSIYRLSLSSCGKVTITQYMCPFEIISNFKLQ
jgi:hypothetical protein